MKSITLYFWFLMSKGTLPVTNSKLVDKTKFYLYPNGWKLPQNLKQDQQIQLSFSSLDISLFDETVFLINLLKWKHKVAQIFFQNHPKQD